MTRAALLVVLVVACGSVTPKASSDAGTGGGLEATGGAGGELGGRGGQGGQPATCTNVADASFALNVDHSCSDAGRCLPTDPRCCYADCQLDTRQFVGCVWSSGPGAGPSVICHASCTDCP